MSEKLPTFKEISLKELNEEIHNMIFRWSIRLTEEQENRIKNSKSECEKLRNESKEWDEYNQEKVLDHVYEDLRDIVEKKKLNDIWYSFDSYQSYLELILEIQFFSMQLRELILKSEEDKKLEEENYE